LLLINPHLPYPSRFPLQDLNIRLRIGNCPRIELCPLLNASSVEKTPAVATFERQPAQQSLSSAVRVEGEGCALPDFRPLLAKSRESWLETRAIYRHKVADREVHVVLLYERNPRFYVVNYILLLFAISSCAAAAWSVPFQQPEDRLALDVTLLLTSVAFKQVLAGTVPPISYLTRLDVYAFGSFAFLLIATCMHACIGWLIDNCNADGDCIFEVGLTQLNARTIDRAFLVAFLSLWLVFNLLYTISVLRHLHRARACFSLANANANDFAVAAIMPPGKAWYDALRSSATRERHMAVEAMSGAI
jgi:hypothetical protein